MYSSKPCNNKICKFLKEKLVTNVFGFTHTPIGVKVEYISFGRKSTCTFTYAEMGV